MEQLSDRNRGHSHAFTSYLSIVGSVLHSSATWLFAALYIIGAAIYLLLGGPSALIAPLGILLVSLLIVSMTITFTMNAPAPFWNEVAPYSRRLLWWQLAACLFFVLLSGVYDDLLFFRPFQSLARYGASYLLGNVVVLLILLVGLPLITMRLLRVPWSELGFGRGYRAWLVLAISCLIPLVVIIVQLVTGRSLSLVARNGVGALLQAGFPEEVFFRGILLTRLLRLFGTRWGIVLGALLFGLVHLPLNVASDRSVLLALAQTILAQATFGIVVAVLFVRTRTIWAGTVFHTLVDATGI